MNLKDAKTFEELKQFLEEWTNFGGGPPYDFMGGFHLFLAILANLASRHNEGDLEALKEFGPWLSESQKAFIYQVLQIG